MDVSLLHALYSLTVVTSIAALVVGLTRKALRRIVGPQLAYGLWLAVPLSALVYALPAPERASNLDAPVYLGPVTDAVRNLTALDNSIATVSAHSTPGIAVWIGGGLLLLVFLVWRHLSFVRSLGDIVALGDGIYRGSGARSPVLVGLWKPRIVLPPDSESDYDEAERRLVMAHEIAHRRRGDLVVNGLALLWLCCFWFNPIMYWAVSRLRFDQELACDASVLSDGHTTTRRYASTLLKTQLLADARLSLPIVCLWQSNHPLKERISALNDAIPGARRRLLGIALSSLTIVASSYFLWLIPPAPLHAQTAPPQQQSFTADSVDSLSGPRLGAAVRAAGFSCSGVVKSNEIGDADTLWRVSCDDSNVYTAAIRQDRICIAPVPYTAPISFGQDVPRPPITPPESCVLVGAI